tara:strand:- start:1240 stop:1605 length:366 start_codon:yes stop_codon:yes gene_type:complete
MATKQAAAAAPAPPKARTISLVTQREVAAVLSDEDFAAWKADHEEAGDVFAVAKNPATQKKYKQVVTCVHLKLDGEFIGDNVDNAWQARKAALAHIRENPGVATTLEDYEAQICVTWEEQE